MRTPLSIFVLFTVSVFSSFIPILPVNAAENCNVVARVLESPDNALKFGAGLCVNQGVSYSKPVRVGCLVGQKVLWVRRSSDLIDCNEKLNNTRPYSPSSRQLLDRMRSGLAQFKPTILMPYGDTLMESPNQIAWKAIGGADSYSVTVLGHKIQRFSVVQPKLRLSPILNTNSIQVLIEAFSGEKLISSSTTTFDFLSSNEAQKVTKDLAMIEKIKLPSQQKNALRLSVLLNSALVNDSIELLQEQVILQPNNPSLIRLMADVFLQAGLYDNASISYIKTMRIAQKIGNRDEFKRAEYGLSLISLLVRNAAS